MNWRRTSSNTTTLISAKYHASEPHGCYFSYHKIAGHSVKSSRQINGVGGRYC
nr:MAG TPA: hypothetical protein [Caudoviricetes sp.]